MANKAYKGYFRLSQPKMKWTKKCYICGKNYQYDGKKYCQNPDCEKRYLTGGNYGRLNRV